MTDTNRDGAALILAVLCALPEDEHLDVLATACSAFIQTNGCRGWKGPSKAEAARNARETKLGPLKRGKSK